MHEAITTTRACRECSRYGLHELFVVIAANGARQVRARCLHCEAISQNIRHEALRFVGVDPLTLPVVRDNSEQGHPCVVCGSRYSEWHHWAPSARFGDAADRYPGDYLCVSCHQEWHRRMTGYDWTAQAS